MKPETGTFVFRSSQARCIRSLICRPRSPAFIPGAGRGALRGLLPLAALHARALFAKDDRPDRAGREKKKTMKTIFPEEGE
jgi:hypothetical protein